MRINKLIFTAIILLIFNQLIAAQTVGLTINNFKKAMEAPPQYKSLFLTKLSLKTADNQPITTNKTVKIPSVFCVEALPFFCKIEYKMGLNKSLPIKFRLGDVQYVNELEGHH